MTNPEFPNRNAKIVAMARALNFIPRIDLSCKQSRAIRYQTGCSLTEYTPDEDADALCRASAWRSGLLLDNAPEGY